MTNQTPPRCGFVAVIGAPNAGKSTLVNRLVGAKIAAVTQKVQTTRARIRGVALEGPAQIVFVDTPGIFTPRRKLDEAMVEAAWGGVEDADQVLMMIDAQAAASALTGEASPAAKRAWEDTCAIIDGLAKAERKAVAVLNKVDRMRKDQLLPLAAHLTEMNIFSEIFYISAAQGEGVDDLKRAVAERLPVGPWLYPEDQAADISERLLSAEITREKLFLRLHEELPYSLTVETESWKDQKDGSARIEQVIFVSRPGHKGIVLGAKGQTIKEVGASRPQGA